MNLRKIYRKALVLNKHFSCRLMSKAQSCLLVFVILLSCVLPQALAEELSLRAERWDLARHGEKILQLSAVRQLVKAWSGAEQQLIELRYPGGEEGEIWVQELSDWLISLGIPSQYIVKVPGSGEADVIKFKLIKAGESYR